MKISEEVHKFKTQLIRGMLERNHGNIRKTARSLGSTPASMQRWVCALDLDDFARQLRRRRDWWLADRCALLGAFACTIFYAAHSMI